MIVKVQVPIVSSNPNQSALVYNEDRSTQFFLPVDAQVVELMGGEPKKFFEIELEGEEGVRFVREVGWQSW